MDRYIQEVKASGRTGGVEEILMPGEIEARVGAERLEKGIPLAEATARDLQSLAARLKLKLDFLGESNQSKTFQEGEYG